MAQPIVEAVVTTQANKEQVSPTLNSNTPQTGFHLHLEGKTQDGSLKIIFDTMVFPSKNSMAGVVFFDGPDHFKTHFSTIYKKSFSGEVQAHIDGYPAFGNGCFGHGPVVNLNAKIDLLLRPEWSDGNASISYNLHPSSGEGEWQTVENIGLSGGAPIAWRGVKDIGLTTSNEPFAVEGDGCEFSEAGQQKATRSKNALHRLGTDESHKDLEFLRTPDAMMDFWSIRNNVGRHILFKIDCSDHVSQMIKGEIFQLHPFETKPLYGLPKKQKQYCSLVRAYFN